MYSLFFKMLVVFLQSLSRKLSKRSSGSIPAALRRKLSTPPEERGAVGTEEVLEGTGALNYALNVTDTADEGFCSVCNRVH